MVTLPADINAVRPRDRAVVLEFNGEHDLTTKAQLAQLLERLIDENDHVVVDETKAQFVDSSFIHNLLVANRVAGETARAPDGDGPDRPPRVGGQWHP